MNAMELKLMKMQIHLKKGAAFLINRGEKIQVPACKVESNPIPRKTPSSRSRLPSESNNLLAVH